MRGAPKSGLMIAGALVALLGVLAIAIPAFTTEQTKEVAKIGDLKKLERLLAKTIARCSGKRVPDCPVLDILDVRRS